MQFILCKENKRSIKILTADERFEEVIAIIHPTLAVAKIKSEKIQALFSERLKLRTWPLMISRVFKSFFFLLIIQLSALQGLNWQTEKG